MAMMMADCVGFQAQIASIIELLANSAVLEICKLVDDGYAALRSQMDLEREQSEKENDDLRRRLRDMDVRVRSYERKLKRRNQREEMHNVHYRPPEVDPTIVTVEVGQTQGPLAVNDSEPEMHHMPQEEPPALPQVKQERADCDMNMKVEIGSSAPEPHQEVACGEQLSLCEPLPPSLTDATVDLTCRPRPRGRPKSSSKPSSSASSSSTALKPETPPPSESSAPPQLPPPPVVVAVVDDDDDDDEPSPERLNSLGLDLAWMQERVGHLGAAFAQASLNHADGGGGGGGVHPSCSYPTDMEVPPAMLFPGHAHHHDMAAFASSFDLPSANASSLARRGPYKGVGASGGAASSSSSSSAAAAGKEPMVCNFCGRVYPSAASLEAHQRSHTGERPYSCQHCGKGFAQPNNLRVHLLIHSSERRYHCSLCGKSFISSSHLKRHRTVHTQEKPYTCARCGQSFSQLCSVRRHRQQSQCGV